MIIDIDLLYYNIIDVFHIFKLMIFTVNLIYNTVFILIA
jgi:hypothetical protein